MYHVDAHWPLAFLAISLLTGAVAAVVRAQALAALSLVALGVWPLAELFELDGDSGLYAPVAAALYGCALYGLGTGDRGVLDRAGFRTPMRALGLPLRARRHVRVHVRAGPPCRRRASRSTGARWRRSSRLPSRPAWAPSLSPCCPADAPRPGRQRDYSPRRSSSCSRCSRRSRPPTAAPSSIRSCSTSLFAALALGTIVVGYVEDEPALVAVGIVAVGVDVLARYVDVFWDFLPRSIGFVGAGLLLLGLAWLLERQRSRLVGSMR